MGLESQFLNYDSNRLNHESNYLQREAHQVNLKTQQLNQLNTKAALRTSRTTQTNVFVCSLRVFYPALMLILSDDFHYYSMSGGSSVFWCRSTYLHIVRSEPSQLRHIFVYLDTSSPNTDVLIQSIV